MRGRREKRIADWFPHVTAHGDSLSAVEERYGNDGYALWFKLLERLGRCEGHFINTNEPQQLALIAAKAHMTHERALEIISFFATFEMIDRGLWEKRVIWSENFVDGLAPLYAGRKAELPQRPGVVTENPPAGIVVGEPVEDRPQTAVVPKKWKSGTLEYETLVAFKKFSPASADPAGNVEAIPKLVSLAGALGDPREVLPRMISAYVGLVNGKLNGISARDRAFWAKQPETPKAMCQTWDRLVGQVKGSALATMQREESEDNPFVRGSEPEEDDESDTEGF